MSPALTPETMPPGDYAIVELFGHTQLIGRVSEIERFGTKMLVVEPIFNGQLLGPVMQGGASIYRLTPCTGAVAFLSHPRAAWALPLSIRSTIPPEALPTPDTDALDTTDGGFF